jgi:hypothetical protein
MAKISTGVKDFGRVEYPNLLGSVQSFSYGNGSIYRLEPVFTSAFFLLVIGGELERTQTAPCRAMLAAMSLSPL